MKNKNKEREEAMKQQINSAQQLNSLSNGYLML